MRHTRGLNTEFRMESLGAFRNIGKNEATSPNYPCILSFVHLISFKYNHLKCLRGGGITGDPKGQLFGGVLRLQTHMGT